MIKLFSYEGFKVVISEEALLLKPFKTIWNRDKSKDKNRALQELGFIYFFCDPRSDYQYLIDEEEREKSIKEGEGLPEDWKPDNAVKEAMTFYSSFKPTASLLLEDTRIAVDKLRKLLREIDLSETDTNGKPIYTLNSLTSTIKQVPALAVALDEAEKALATEIRQSVRVRGGSEKTIFEDDLNS